MSAIAILETHVTIHSMPNHSADSQPLLESKTITAAKIAFADLKKQLESLPAAKLLPNANAIVRTQESIDQVETSASSSSSSPAPKRRVFTGLSG